MKTYSVGNVVVYYGVEYNIIERKEVDGLPIYLLENARGELTTAYHNEVLFVRDGKTPAREFFRGGPCPLCGSEWYICHLGGAYATCAGCDS